MTLQSAFIVSLLALVLSIAAHWFVRRYWWAVLIGTAACSLVNIVHEAFRHDFQVRPADVLFWIPMLFVEGMVLAFSIAALVGIPFYVFRRKKQSNAI